jgi:peptide/nickel transport system ATP-binding protein
MEIDSPADSIAPTSSQPDLQISSPMKPALLNVQNLWVTYPQPESSQQVNAIEDLSFQLAAGEKVGFVGESGCGKSTLGKAIMRLLPNGSRIAGEMLFEGQSIAQMEPEALRRFRGEGVGLVFQDPMIRLDPLMSIGNHCMETLQAHDPTLTKQQAKDRALKTLAAVKIDEMRWNQFPHEFSGGMRQRVAIALALLLDPKLIIADEPTTSLDVCVSAEILKELTGLCKELQMGLLLISHDLATIATYCDRIVVMNQGRKEEEGTVKQIFGNPQAAYTKTLMESALHIHVHDSVPKLVPETISHQANILKLTDLDKYYTIETSLLQRLFTGAKTKTIKAVDKVNIELKEGEIFGLVGESGCGKSTLSRTILQLIPATGGSVTFQGEELTTLSSKVMRGKRREMQMIFQDPSASLNPMMTVGASITDPLLIHQLTTRESHTKTKVLKMLEAVGLGAEHQAKVLNMLESVGLGTEHNESQAKAKVLKMLEAVGLGAEYYGRYPNQLSGGQQQRVGIARALITEPKLVICDEPVSMLDATIQAEVLELMLQLKRDLKLTYLFITHDLWLAKFLCDRIAVMHEGQIVEQGETQQIFNHPKDPYTKKLLAAAPLLAKQG